MYRFGQDHQVYSSASPPVPCLSLQTPAPPSPDRASGGSASRSSARRHPSTTSSGRFCPAHRFACVPWRAVHLFGCPLPGSPKDDRLDLHKRIFRTFPEHKALETKKPLTPKFLYVHMFLLWHSGGPRRGVKADGKGRFGVALPSPTFVEPSLFLSTAS